MIVLGKIESTLLVTANSDISKDVIMFPAVNYSLTEISFSFGICSAEAWVRTAQRPTFEPRHLVAKVVSQTASLLSASFQDGPRRSAHALHTLCTRGPACRGADGPLPSSGQEGLSLAERCPRAPGPLPCFRLSFQTIHHLSVWWGSQAGRLPQNGVQL